MRLRMTASLCLASWMIRCRQAYPLTLAIRSSSSSNTRSSTTLSYRSNKIATFRRLSQRQSLIRCMATLEPPPASTANGDNSPTNNEDDDVINSITTLSEEQSTSIYDREAEALAHLQSPFLITLRDRGFLHQCSNIVELDKQLMGDDADVHVHENNNNDDNNNILDAPESKVIAAYLGFDATADSLHVGSLLQIMILRHWQHAHHQPIVLLGGGTSQIGDPTGKDESRILLTKQVIAQNIAGIQNVFAKFLTFGHGPTDAILVNNNDWLSNLQYLDFLRTYGRHFTMNRMLSFESVKQRLRRENAPLTFLEFNYMILQAYDFVELYRRYQTILQLGGSDQWGNMVAGSELGRKVEQVQLFCLTAPLITTSDGRKMGKTAGGAVWLNKDKLSEYDYWQFWRNTNDDDVVRFLKLFTELPLDEIATLGRLHGAQINDAKRILADEATALLHGRDCLQAIHETADNMFVAASNNDSSTESLPRICVSRSDLQGKDDKGGTSVRYLDVFVNLGLAGSKKEARRLIQGGGARLSGDDTTIIEDENGCLSLSDFGSANEVTVRAGKKRAGVVEISD